MSAGTAGEMKKGDVVTCEVAEIKESGLDVKIVGTELMAFIKRSELARDREEQKPERFQVGQKFDARVTQFDRRAHKVQVSIKALEVAEEKDAIAQYGSSDSGATLGDILGTALKRAEKKRQRVSQSASSSGGTYIVPPFCLDGMLRLVSLITFPALPRRHAGAAMSAADQSQEPPMPLDADTIVDRRRLRRKLTFWRVVAFLLVAAVVAGGAFAISAVARA